jgi:predicted Zn-ribbon and HTH transcriptional regulator
MYSSNASIGYAPNPLTGYAKILSPYTQKTGAYSTQGALSGQSSLVSSVYMNNLIIQSMQATVNANSKSKGPLLEEIAEKSKELTKKKSAKCLGCGFIVVGNMPPDGRCPKCSDKLL